MFHIQCPLGHTLEVDAEHVAQRLSCPVCQAVLYVPPVPAGSPPYAKYEVICSRGHILRVKQKYLHKEIKCPACQVTVSMHPSHLLTASGATLGMTSPDLVRVAVRKNESASGEKGANGAGRSAARQPAAPEVVEESREQRIAADSRRSKEMPAQGAGQTVSDQSGLELDIVDSQLNIEMKRPAGDKKSASRRSEASGRIPPPPPSGVTAEDLQMNCPNGHLLAVERQFQGQFVQCPLCQAIMQVPMLAEQGS